MKKIYWMVQQLNKIGGTEMVSILLMNNLIESYDITLVSTSEKVDNEVYQVNPKIKKIYLGVPHQVTRFDEYATAYLKKFKIFSFLCLVGKLLKHFFFKKKYYRKKMQELVDKDDIIIASSLDSYLYCPKNRKVVYHYHFNAKTYLSMSNCFLLSLCRKPDKTVFLTKATYDQVTKKYPKKKSSCLYIYNPCRFERHKIEKSAEDKIPHFIFIGRLVKQKNPLLLMKVALYLKEQNFDFTLDILGDGPLRTQMESYQKNNGLEEMIHFKGMCKDIVPYLEKADALLMTSIFEGFPLGIIESSSYSVFTFTTNWGDAVEEIIEENKNGLIINSFNPKEIGDIIIKTMSKNINNLKVSSFESSIRFELTNCLSNWKKLFEELSYEL